MLWTVTGLWPLVHPRSFVAVIAPLGTALLVAGARGRVAPELALGWVAARG